jgi:hypothetical protein
MLTARRRHSFDAHPPIAERSLEQPRELLCGVAQRPTCL